jgi:DNA topoisomerase VI subunit B
MDPKKITIEKVGAEEKAGPRKTIKTFPRGILKKKRFTLKGVTDPAKGSPLKKGMRRHTLRMLTEKGLKKHRKTLKNKIARMKDKEVSDLVRQKGLVTNLKTPPEISRQILDNAVSAGFVSV